MDDINKYYCKEIFKQLASVGKQIGEVVIGAGKAGAKGFKEGIEECIEREEKNENK